MTATISTVSFVQYNVLQAPVVLPTPEELFSFQVGTLRNEGIDLPDKDVARLHALIPNEPQLFLVVPPQPDMLDLNGLMNLVEVNGKTGKSYLDRQHLTDVKPVPRGAHLLLDVEDGRQRLNTRPSVSFENIRRDERVPYSTWYGLIHAIVFPCVLQDHYLHLVGSRYVSDRVPGLYLADGVPMLYYPLHGHVTPIWGAPSAGRAVGI